MFSLSVVVCTHNPRPDYLRRVLNLLEKQDLNQTCWELLLIDNASAKVLASEWDLSWHQASRHIREDEAGLTAARLRAIGEAKGKLLVFVDDDNVLARDYLSTALRIADEFRQLGAWGGSTIGEFESQPPSWFNRYAGWVGVREVLEASWSNDPLHSRSNPIGAGLVIRKEVCDQWAIELAGNEGRRNLGRSGESLMSGEDFDMIYTGCSMGFGKGVFPELSLNHLIPERRYSPKYIEEILEMISYSKVIHHHSRGLSLPQPQAIGTIGRWKRKMRVRFLPTMELRFWEARQRGFERGHQQIAKLGK